MGEEAEDGERYVREFIEQRICAGAPLASVLAEFGIELEHGRDQLDVETVRRAFTMSPWARTLEPRCSYTVHFG